jgi:hypothetical protein
MTSQERSTFLADVIHDVSSEWRHVVAEKLVEAGGALMIAGTICQAAARRLRRNR